MLLFASGFVHPRQGGAQPGRSQGWTGLRLKRIGLDGPIDGVVVVACTG